MSRRAIIPAVVTLRKMVIVGVVAILVLLAVVLLGARTRHNQCCICGVQEYERSLMGIVVESWCEREYDEYGTYEQWRQMTGDGVCHHEFRPVSEYGLARSLEALSHIKLGLADAEKTITRGMLSDDAYGLLGQSGAKEVASWSGAEHKSPVETCYLLG